MDFLKDMLINKVIISAFASWFIAQFLKMFIETIKRKKIKTKEFVFRALFGTGGMPSSHSASVMAVALAIGIQEGFDSALFAMSFVLVFIVVRDATGVRLASGFQAKAINQIIKKVDELSGMREIKEVRGHTPLECFVGMLVGALVTLGVYFIK
ncbi:MAG: divergent PAP2 family protein [Spirochaetes bacterium]|nr:divergent PAP2 family protein [Spirochaetota bacterium]